LAAFNQYEEARRILVRAVAEIKGGEYPTARRYLERLLHLPSTSEQKADAHYWLSRISETESEKRDHLQTALGYDLTHHRARKALAILDGRLAEDEIINPDDFERTVPQEQQVRDGDRFECPTCGARMVFSPDGQTLVCEHCANEGIAGQDGFAEEQEFLLGISTAKGHQQAVAMQSFECKACGAVYLLGPQTISITCAHCDSTYSIIQSEVRELIPPEGIITMAVEETKAEALVREKIARESKKTPGVQFISFQGVYLPAWTFDLGGQIKWTGYIEYQENRPMPVRDSRTIHFDDFFVPASKPVPKFLRRLLREFSAEDVRAFRPEYVASWLAESYQIAMADAAVEARAAVFKEAQKKAITKSHLDNVQNLRFYSDDIMLTSYKLVLVPVWIGQLKVEDKKLPVLINGLSGKVYMDQIGGWMKKALNWLLDE
jgi:hypothetical protein